MQNDFIHLMNLWTYNLKLYRAKCLENSWKRFVKNDDVNNVYTTNQKFGDGKIFNCFWQRSRMLTKAAFIWNKQTNEQTDNKQTKKL